MPKDVMARKAVNALSKELQEFRRQNEQLQKDIDEIKQQVRLLSGLPAKEVLITWGGKKEE